MTEKNLTEINYIFYLQTKNSLGRYYYQLSDEFSQVNINLIPILAEDLINLKNLDRGKKNHLIFLRNDFSSANQFNQLKKTFLDSAMAGGRMVLFDLSSFSEIEATVQYQNKKVYRYFQLPQNIKQIAMTITVDFFHTKNTQSSWPGGKRSKLPSIDHES